MIVERLVNFVQDISARAPKQSGGSGRCRSRPQVYGRAFQPSGAAENVNNAGFGAAAGIGQRGANRKVVKPVVIEVAHRHCRAQDPVG